MRNCDREEKANEKRQKLSTLRKLYPEWLNYKSLETTAPSISTHGAADREKMPDGT
jgi:hypothetical protein